VPVIEAVLQEAQGEGPTIIDGPPGTSCALVAAAGGADIALVVTEPTPFGLHDLAAALDVSDVLKVPTAVVINKAGEEDAGIGDFFKKRLPGWRGFVFTGNPDLAAKVGLKPRRKTPLFNAKIECRLLEYELYQGTRRAPRQAEAPDANAD
jgi:hypothetical protein